MTLAVLAAAPRPVQALDPDDSRARASAALPFIGSGPPELAPLPEFLSSADAARYAEIFALQEKGEWKRADREIAALHDPLLMGHVLAQRYLHPTAYRSKFAELSAWLEKYADHPEAWRIYKLAKRRMPAGAQAPKRPASFAFPSWGEKALETRKARQAIPSKERNASEAQRLKELEAQIRRRLGRGWPSGARKVLNTAEFDRLASAPEFDSLQAEIAHGYFVHGKDELAFAMAAKSAKRSGDFVPEAYWTAGLAAWRLGDPVAARVHFEALAQSPQVLEPFAAAAAYWAARADLITRRPERVNRFLAIAARFPRTFYGLLARRALGFDMDFLSESTPLTARDIAELTLIPGVVRSLALARVGQTARAVAELRKLYHAAPPPVLERLIALAERLDAPRLAIQMGLRLLDADGRSHDGALYPLPAWRPARGYIVDRALVFGVMRQESKFNAKARNGSGARGLMQLMPATASLMAKRIGLDGISRRELFDPEVNITLGQEYLSHLLRLDLVGGNLFYLAAAYNGGPAKLAKWLSEVDFGDDPLLFIETIPAPETRLFIEKVMVNLWIYRLRLRQKTPSLDAVASGGWPFYIPQDSDLNLADHARN